MWMWRNEDINEFMIKYQGVLNIKTKCYYKGRVRKRGAGVKSNISKINFIIYWNSFEKL